MQTIVNLGTGGADLNGQNGSTTSADSNDALFLDWPGDNAGNYVYLPGIASNTMSVLDEAALDITGNLDIRAYVALDDWTPVATQAFVSKFDVSGQFSYEFRLVSSGLLVFGWSEDGTATLSASSSVAPTIGDGEALWVRVTVDVDNGASGRDIKFFTSVDGATWTQLGTTVTQAGTTSIHAGTSLLRFGSRGTGGFNSTGKFYRAQVLNGIDGTPVLDVDCSQITSGSATSFTATTGQTVTINRSTSGRKSVAVVSPVWLFGTDDYMEVADNALLDFGTTDSFTVLAVVRQWSTPLSNGRYVSKKDGIDEGWDLLSAGTTLAPFTAIEDASTNTVGRTGVTVPSGSLALFGSILDRSAQTLAVVTNTTISATISTSGIGDISSDVAMRIGRVGGAPFVYQDFEFLAVAVFRRVLSQSEIFSVLTYYQARLS